MNDSCSTCDLRPYGKHCIDCRHYVHILEKTAFLISDLIAMAAKKYSVDRKEIDFYAWPDCSQDYKRTIFGFHCTLFRHGYLWYNNRWKRVDEFKPFINWR